MRNLITCWLLLYCICPLLAQKGSYFLTHHSPGDENVGNVCFDMAQDDNGIMYFAMKAGVLEFDGREWDLIPGAGAIYALHRTQAGKVFWGGAKGFGEVGYDDKGFKKLQYLSDSSVTNAFQILSVGNDVYFLSENSIFSFSEETDRAGTVIQGNRQEVFSGMFELFGAVYVQTERNTIFRVERNMLVYVNLNFSGNVVFQLRKDDGYVLGTSDNRIYICDKDLAVRQMRVKDQPYADANVLVGGAWVNHSLLALGTLRGGVMLIDPANGERDQIIDYATGLPDNEVFALMADADQNLWVAHEYGFTQISPNLPFRSYSYYAGLEGNMLCAYSYKNTVYVGTSLGLFKLDKEELYEEIINQVEVGLPRARGKKDTPSSLTDSRRPVAQEEPSARKRGFFGFLRRNRDRNDGGDAGITEKDAANGQAARNADPRMERRIEKVLRSSRHVFKRVEGISAKITHLVEADGKLVAAGLEGVFEVADLTAEPILRSPTRYAYASVRSNTVIASTYDDGIWSLAPEKTWKPLNLINSLGDQIDFIFEGAVDEWWLCGIDRIYRLQLNGSDIRHLQTVAMANPNFERTVGVYLDDEAIFVNADGFFRLDRQSTLQKIDTLPAPAQYFALDGHILYRDEHGWHILGAGEDSNLQLLNLFQNLRHITTDEAPGNLWMISGSNELLKYEGGNISAPPSKFPIFLKSIQNNSVKIADFRHIQLDQINSAVTFEVVQPDFINPRSIEFRYLLEGMHQDWSDWSSANNKINFPYLPPGEYYLKVQARNIFGKVSDLAPLPFEVIPPYWKQPWFYALEFMVFASLVILSFRLSTRYRIISRFLSLITIILLIEFIQTVIGSSIISDDSPVVEFLLQFVVAILILPVEGFLRNLMLRSLDSSSRFYSFISPGGQARLPAGKTRRRSKVKETL